jgi:hypothetical protein
MSWLGRLLGRDPQLNPEQYERVRCDRCDGRGHPPLPYRPGDVTYNMRVPCGKCDGKGWVLVRRDADDVRDMPEGHIGIAMDAPQAASGVLPEVTVAETGEQPALPDAPLAPKAPEAPRGLDEDRLP